MKQSLTRKTSTRDPKTRILVVCEGENTEIQYIEGLARHFGASPRVDITPIGIGDDPLNVVNHAIQERGKRDREARRARDANLRFDEVWCLVDVDEHRRLPQALDRARANEVELVVSNPCFEIWLLFHYQPFVSSIDRKGLRRDKLRGHLPKYDKNLPSGFPYARHPQAERHARNAAPEHERACVKGPNPSTTAWLLVRSIERAGSKNRSET